MIEYSNYKLSGNQYNVNLINNNGLMIGNRSFPFNLKEKKALKNLKNILDRL